MVPCVRITRRQMARRLYIAVQEMVRSSVQGFELTSFVEVKVNSGNKSSLDSRYYRVDYGTPPQQSIPAIIPTDHSLPSRRYDELIPPSKTPTTSPASQSCSDRSFAMTRWRTPFLKKRTMSLWRTSLKAWDESRLTLLNQY